MGLDMYLKAEVYVSKYSGRVSALPAFRTLAAVLNLPEHDEELSSVESYTFETTVGYWRKANAIHSWFVREVQDGVDECVRHHVSREKLEELRKTCDIILKSTELVDGEVNAGYSFAAGAAMSIPIVEAGKVMSNTAVAQELLAPKNGFFFGSTDYDEWYLADLELTIKIIDRALDIPGSVDLYYRSSW